jgi:hypothetical protein
MECLPTNAQENIALEQRAVHRPGRGSGDKGRTDRPARGAGWSGLWSREFEGIEIGVTVELIKAILALQEPDQEIG